MRVQSVTHILTFNVIDFVRYASFIGRYLRISHENQSLYGLTISSGDIL